MRYLTNEKGNAAFYMLWLVGIVLLLFVIVINIAKVYVVKEQSSLVVDQAAFAGTSVIIDHTKEAIARFDASVFSISQKVMDGGKSITQLVDEKTLSYTNVAQSDAYIRALNEVLPERIDKYPPLRQEFMNSFHDVEGLVSPYVQDIILENKSNVEDTEITFSKEKWRLEVVASSTFESVSDQKIIPLFQKKIKQKGYGPSLRYLEKVFQ
ncbi:Tad domain-containing protein [Peribacillus acanthi]|uniref:Tad domain-containing protein n=1 Tax=Peribacillus acanthi TaxID=2171554 RepID=UPI000D3E51A6|nr:Tad domain-containing protein [Peribacillus acanthi]